MTQDADAYYKVVLDNLYNEDSAYNNHESPTQLPHSRLNDTIDRIKRYGEMTRDQNFTDFCDVVVGRTFAVEWDRLNYFRFRTEEDAESEDTTSDYNHPPGVRTATANDKLRSRLESDLDVLFDYINSLKLMMFDPSYVPYIRPEYLIKPQSQRDTQESSSKYN